MLAQPPSTPPVAEPTRRVLLRRAATLGGAVLVGGALDLSTAATPAVAVARPPIATRAQWQARPPTSTGVVLGRGPDHIVVHHTASANSSDFSVSHAHALSRSIQNFHMDGNGWADIGQQFTISRGGHLMEGRNRTLESLTAGTLVVGAQTAGHNEHTIGIECEGLYTSAGPTSALWSMLVQLCAHLCERYGFSPATAIVGHRNYVATACPGDRLYGMLPQLRQEVSAVLGVAQADSPAGPMPDLGAGRPASRRTFDHGPARLSGERR